MSSPTSRHFHQRRNSLELLQHAKRWQEKYILHPFWINTSMGKIEEVAQVPDVDIAEAGCFKYVLIEVRDRATTYGTVKLVVRGDASCTYHGDVFDRMAEQIDGNKLTLNCIGGGRIRVDPGTRTISVYDTCQEFGRADHEKTVEILKKKYPQWTITMTEEEY